MRPEGSTRRRHAPRRASEGVTGSRGGHRAGAAMPRGRSRACSRARRLYELNTLFIGRLRPVAKISVVPSKFSSTRLLDNDNSSALPFFHSTRAHRRPGMTKPRTSPGTPPGVAVGGGAAARDFQDHLRTAPTSPSFVPAHPSKDPDTSNERVVLLPVDGGRGIETDAVLKWCVDNLYRDGDTFLLLHVAPRRGWRRRAREAALGYEPSEVSHSISLP